MFNLFKKFFGPKLSVIDKMIQFFGPSTVCIWNGIGCNGEYEIPVSGRKPKDWKDTNFQWINLSFGKYFSDSSCLMESSHPIIEIWIDKDLNIMRLERHHPESREKAHRNEKMIDKLYDQLQDARKLVTENPLLLKWIETFFQATPRSRYNHYRHINAALMCCYDDIDRVARELSSDERGLAEDELLAQKIKEAESVPVQQTPVRETEPDIEAALGIERKKEKVKKGKHR